MKSLRRKILVPTALLTVVVGAALAYLAWDSALQARSLEQNADAVRSATAFALAVTEAVHDEKHWVSLLSSGVAAGHVARIDEADARIAELARQIEALPLSPSSRAAGSWRHFVQARAALRSLREEMLAAKLRGDAPEVPRALDKWNLMSDRAEALLQNFTAYHLRFLDRNVAELQRRRMRVLVTAGVAVCFGLLLACALSLAIARTVVRPIVDMAKAAERVTATGPPSQVAGAGRRDEIGILARSFNGMTARLVTANTCLAEAVRAREDFISIASHELKTPLTPLQLRVQQLLRLAHGGSGEAIPRDQVLHATGNLEKHVTRLGKLVDNLLDVSRITSGRLLLTRDEHSVMDVVRDALDRVSDELVRAGCEIRLECERDVRIPVDRSRFEQVLVNLLGNAAKYAPGAPVVVRIASRWRGVAVEVEDGGPGIAPEDHARIFTRYERAVPNRHEVSGLGLGLFIAREIVRAHGGEIVVRSAPGNGATFIVGLPFPGRRRAERRTREAACYSSMPTPPTTPKVDPPAS